MRITADTNVLLRAIVGDDPVQSAVARQLLSSAEMVVVTVPTLCELTWVLRSTYRQSTDDICAVIRRLLETSNVLMDTPSVNAGLIIAEAGGNFADGVIAFEGQLLGSETFATFDRAAHQLLSRSGTPSLLLSPT